MGMYIMSSTVIEKLKKPSILSILKEEDDRTE